MERKTDEEAGAGNAAASVETLINKLKICVLDGFLFPSSKLFVIFNAISINNNGSNKAN